MELFEQSAPVLMKKAVDVLALIDKERPGITHVLVTCCTGHYARGLVLKSLTTSGFRRAWSAQ